MCVVLTALTSGMSQLYPYNLLNSAGQVVGQVELAFLAHFHPNTSAVCQPALVKANPNRFAARVRIVSADISPDVTDPFGGYIDPYVQLLDGEGNILARTNELTGNQPIWNSAVTVLGVTSCTMALIFEVWDDDGAGLDDFAGRVAIQLDTLTSAAPKAYMLSGAPGATDTSLIIGIELVDLTQGINGETLLTNFQFITTKTWSNLNDSTPDRFPERALPQFSGRSSNITRGACFSGGGKRSYAATVGQLRALEEIGLLDHMDYVSVVSGGSWALAVFLYAQESRASLLGAFRQPSELTSDLLLQPFSQDMSMGKAISIEDSPGFELLDLDELFAEPDMVWLNAVADNIFSPFGLHDKARRCHFTLNSETKVRANEREDENEKKG